MGLSYDLLDDTAVRSALAELPGWRLDGGRIAKEFAFPAYARAALFCATVAHVAERLDHHPDLTLTYGKVQVATSTHSAGGVTGYDLELARRIEALL